jgi:cytochrome c
MDSFEFNKIAGAVLGACLGIMVIGKVSNALVHPHIPEKPHIPVTEVAAKPTTPDAAPAKAPAAEGDDAKAGEVVFNNTCKVCHTADKGGRVITGPNLFGIVGNKKAHLEGFKYSKGMLEKGGQWTDEDLNEFLFSPAAYIKGTAMAFRGVKNNKDRGNLISYLKTLK